MVAKVYDDAQGLQKHNTGKGKCMPCIVSDKGLFSLVM